MKLNPFAGRVAGTVNEFAISFGTLEHGVWTLERSALPALEGTAQPCSLTRQDDHTALVHCDGLAPRWQVLEWHGVHAPV